MWKWVQNNIIGICIIVFIIIISIFGYNFINGSMQSINKNYQQLLTDQQKFTTITNTISRGLDDISKSITAIGKTITSINGTIGDIKRFGGAGSRGSAEAQRLIKDQRIQLEELKRILESTEHK